MLRMRLTRTETEHTEHARYDANASPRLTPLFAFGELTRAFYMRCSSPIFPHTPSQFTATRPRCAKCACTNSRITAAAAAVVWHEHGSIRVGRVLHTISFLSCLHKMRQSTVRARHIDSTTHITYIACTCTDNFNFDNAIRDDCKGSGCERC